MYLNLEPANIKAFHSLIHYNELLTRQFMTYRKDFPTCLPRLSPPVISRVIVDVIRAPTNGTVSVTIEGSGMDIAERVELNGVPECGKLQIECSSHPHLSYHSIYKSQAYIMEHEKNLTRQATVTTTYAGGQEKRFSVPIFHRTVMETFETIKELLFRGVIVALLRSPECHAIREMSIYENTILKLHSLLPVELLIGNIFHGHEHDSDVLKLLDCATDQGHQLMSEIMLQSLEQSIGKAKKDISIIVSANKIRDSHMAPYSSVASSAMGGTIGSTTVRADNFSDLTVSEDLIKKMEDCLSKLKSRDDRIQCNQFCGATVGSFDRQRLVSLDTSLYKAREVIESKSQNSSFDSKSNDALQFAITSAVVDCYYRVIGVDSLHNSVEKDAHGNINESKTTAAQVSASIPATPCALLYGITGGIKAGTKSLYLQSNDPNIEFCHSWCSIYTDWSCITSKDISTYCLFLEFAFDRLGQGTQPKPSHNKMEEKLFLYCKSKNITVLTLPSDRSHKELVDQLPELFAKMTE
eukprot:147496-Ditylum_brightwellii.AAC.1